MQFHWGKRLSTILLVQNDSLMKTKDQGYLLSRDSLMKVKLKKKTLSTIGMRIA